MVDKVLDASDLRCPMPLLKTRLALSELLPGQLLEVVATDAGSARDIPAYLHMSSHELVSLADDGNQYRFIIRRGD